MNGHPRSDRLVGIDVGGTKTHLAVIDDAGERRDIVGASSEWRSGHLFSDEENLPRLAAWIAARTRIGDATTIVIGLRDCDTDADIDLAGRTLSTALDHPVRVQNDADLLGPAMGVDHAVAMVVGTGSIVSARDAAGRRITADGYGWLFGDWGSGPGLVRDAIGRVLTAADAGEATHDSLTSALFDHFDSSNAAELAGAATIVTDPLRLGEAAPLVFAAAHDGSLLARETIAFAADRLVDGVAAVIRRGGLGEQVVAAGGVIVNQPALREAVSARLAGHEHPLRLSVLDVPPVEGALRLAASVAV
ncbi:BadF/BadG/BcrA/BcrD ATPase family protein [Rathayibacter sp. CAU 1779]